MPPRVILGDQAPGLIASVSLAFPNAIIQSCSWHAVEAMVARFLQTGYLKAYVMGETLPDNSKTAGLKGLA